MWYSLKAAFKRRHNQPHQNIGREKDYHCFDCCCCRLYKKSYFVSDKEFHNRQR